MFARDRCLKPKFKNALSFFIETTFKLCILSISGFIGVNTMILFGHLIVSSFGNDIELTTLIILPVYLENSLALPMLSIAFPDLSSRHTRFFNISTIPFIDPLPQWLSLKHQTKFIEQLVLAGKQ